jgi:hypothetical protein
LEPPAIVARIPLLGHGTKCPACGKFLQKP